MSAKNILCTENKKTNSVKGQPQLTMVCKRLKKDLDNPEKYICEFTFVYIPVKTGFEICLIAAFHPPTPRINEKAGIKTKSKRPYLSSKGCVKSTVNETNDLLSNFHRSWIFFRQIAMFVLTSLRIFTRIYQILKVGFFPVKSQCLF